jgi:hypothetical protein
MLGRRAKFPAGPPMLAMRYDAALIPAYAQRMGPFNYKLTMHAPIALDTGVKRREAIKSAVQAYADILASTLLEQPGSWDWEMVPGTLGSGEYIGGAEHVIEQSEPSRVTIHSDSATPIYRAGESLEST